MSIILPGDTQTGTHADGAATLVNQGEPPVQFLKDLVGVLLGKTGPVTVRFDELKAQRGRYIHWEPDPHAALVKVHLIDDFTRDVG